jgi:hypothetical protein
MPVTINGDGSISGLAVGGLPDGSVDADTLASNAVTTAKLASGAATQAKRTYSTGEIVKVQTFKGSNADVQGTTNTDVVLEAFTFTTAYANSRLLIYYHSGQIKRHIQDMNGWIWTSVDSTNRHGNMYHYIDHNHYFYGHDTSLTNDHRAFNVGFDVSNQLSAGSHTVRIGCYSYGGVATFNHQGSSAGRRFSVIVMEVAS